MGSLLVVLFAPNSPADEAVDLADSIPSERFYTASVLVGSDVWTFGGQAHNGTRLLDILKYTPVGANATNVSGLEKTIHSMSAVSDGSVVFIFGGDDGEGNGTRIVKYDPATNTSAEVAYLPTGRQWTSAVWTGEYAYVFGGKWEGVRRGEVIRFNPTTLAVDRVVNNTSTFASSATSAAWDGEHAYIFASEGDDCNGDHNACNDIVRWTPSNNSTTIMGPTFPTPRYGTAAASDGLAVYIFGNHDNAGTSEIWRYRPSTDNLTRMSDDLPAPRRFPNAVSKGTSVFVLTGGDGADPWPTSIVRYNLTPGKPIDMLLDSGNGGPVEINSTWLPPPNNTYTHPITNYTLYRNPIGLAVDKVIKLGNVTSHTDNDGLTSPLTYCYNVTATNIRGEGPPFPGLLGPPRCAVAW